MPRIIARVVFVLLMSIVAAALGTITALVTVGPGKDLLARLLSEESNRLVRGSVSIGRIRGDFLTGLTLDSVVIRDTAGVMLADAARVELGFQLANLIAERLVFTDVQVIEPRLHVVKHRSGRMNYQEIFKLGEGPPGGGGEPPLFRLENLSIVNGRVEILTPWNPDGRLRTDAQKDSALTAERARPGRRVEPGERAGDGLMLVRVIDRLTARFPMMVISTPDRRPFFATIDTLAASVSDPGITITDLDGRITQGADSLLFDFERAALPNTVVTGSGRVDWPRDTMMFRFTMTAPRLDLVDLRWISPKFPGLSGRGSIRATSLSGVRTEYDIRNLVLSDRTSRAAGRLIAITDIHRGLGFRDLDLELTNLDLEHVRPFLDTLPLAGRLTGPLRVTGFFDRMTVSADWLFEDSRVEGGATNRLALEGDLSLGGADGMTFHGTRILGSDFDLRTVRLITPAVILDGRMALAGSLDGGWRNVTFTGRLDHRDGERPASSLGGRARLDTRGPLLGLDAELEIDSLSFDGLRGSFPTIPMAGRIAGPIRLAGFLDSLRVEGQLAGEIGAYRLAGIVGLEPPRMSATGLRIDFQRADLAMLSGTGPSTSLSGRLELTGQVDSLVAPVAEVDLVTGPGTVREFGFDSVAAKLRIRDSLLTVDTAFVQWEGGGLSAKGTFGWAAPHEGRLEIAATALSLAPFDSLAAELAGLERAELAGQDLMAGRGRGSAVVSGSLDRWTAAGTVRIDSLAWLSNRVQRAGSTFEIAGGRLDSLRLDITATADSIRRGQLAFGRVTASAEGAPDDLAWSVGGDGPRATRLGAGGHWSAASDSVRSLRIDSLAASILGRSWRLANPVRIAIDSATVVDTIAIATDDGSGSIRVAGTLPGRRAGQLEVEALGIGLRDIYALMLRDTAGVAGVLSLDLRMGGTLDEPTLRGSANLTGPVIGQVRAPLVRTVFNYQDRLLQSNVSFWRTGRTVLDVDARLPLDLGMGEVTRRQLPGELVIRAHADSVDLGIIEALTPNLRGVVGNLALDAQVGGSWEAPRLGGFIALTDAAMFFPGLGVSYGPMHVRLQLSGDSVIADSVVIHSGIGRARILGGVRFGQLTHPTLALRASASDFAVIDVPDYLTLRATGDLQFTGAIERPVLTGELRATSSVLYFEDLLTKDIVNLEDPAYADLVDTTALRTQHLGAQFQSRLLDSLTIRDLRLRVAQDVWLRSSEANIQLEGEVTVNKQPRRGGRSEFRVSGQFSAPRGTYSLRLALGLVRTFTVEQGTVQYFNTTDLNAGLDLSARYVVRTVSGAGTDDYPIIARITGTLLQPKLNLTSEAGRIPLPERDLVSLLVFGSTSSSLLSGGFSNEGDLATSWAGSVLSTGFRDIVSASNSSFDFVDVNPGFLSGSGTFATASNVTSISLGRQLSNRLFATINLGGCVHRFEFNRQYLGASLEYRLHPTLKLQIVGEPVQSCLSDVASTLVRPSRYQFGADIKWDRDY